MIILNMTTKTVANRFRALGLVCALVAGVLLAHLTLSPPTPALTQDAGIIIADASAVEEGEDVEFVVTLNATSSQVVSLTWTTADGTAASSTDYVATTSGMVSFPANSVFGATTTITVRTVDDEVVEPDESFSVTITGTSLPTGITITDPRADGTITDDDEADISIADASAAEGEAVEFTVTLSKPVSQDVSLKLTTADGTAASSTDYMATTAGTVMFGALSTTTTFMVQTMQDMVVEPDETFMVTLATSTPLLAGVSFADGGASAEGTITNDDDATITIANSDAVNEGGMATFTVTLSHPVSQAVSLTWTVTGGTSNPTMDDDFEMTTGTVSFAALSTTGMLTVQTKQDQVVEPDETFTVTIVGDNLPGDVTVDVDNDEGTGSITNNDTAVITIEDASAEEGDAVQFTVTLSASVSKDSSLTWLTADDTATTADNDYAAETSGTVSFPADSAAGATTTITVQTTQDVVVEPDETFTVTLSTSTLIAGVSISYGEATGTITNDDTAEISIEDASAVEGEVVEFVVTLTVPVSQAVNLTWSTADGTANGPGDYAVTTSGTASFEANSTTTTITVQTEEDDVVEPDENFTVTLAAAGMLLDGVSITDGVATGTILNDDDAQISIANAQPVGEGGGAGFTVMLDNPVSQPIGLSWEVTGGMVDPTMPNDFDATTGTVSFSALSTTTTITVRTKEDEVVEPAENFKVNLATTTMIANVSFADGEATGSITNDDTASITIADASAAEGNGVDFVVTLSKPVAQEVSLTWATTDGTAEAPGDYTATTSGMVMFPANSAAEATMTVTVDTAEDEVVEPDEMFTVTLATSTQLLAGVSFGRDEATGTITNDDSANITITDGTAVEGGSVTFTVRLSKSVSQDVSLTWATTDGTAEAPGDYTAVSSGTVLFPANSAAGTTTTVTVQTVEDAVVEPVENFRVTLAAVGMLLPGVSIADGVGTGRITNDDSAEIHIADASAEEGEPVVFVVRLSESVSQQVSLTWTTTDDTAEAPGDYAAVTAGVATFPANSDPGATTTVTVVTAEEAVVEPAESFSVTLSGTLLSGVSIADAMATGTITNDDTAGITIANSSAEEGESVEFIVTLGASVSQDVNLTWSTADGTAVAGGDYTATTSGMVLFPANSDAGATMTITVDTREDAVVEPPESFSVALATTTPLLLEGVSITDGVATGRITNDDTAAITIADASAEEGESVVFVVRLSASVSEEVSLTWTTADGTAVAPDDYTAVSGGTASFGPNSAPGATTTITVMTVEDAVVEPVESFRVNLSGTLLSGVRITDGQGNGSITNDDSARITISDARASEGREIEFIVRLSASVSQEVTLIWTTVEVTAEALVDYDAVATGTVAFAANSGPGATRTITVETFGDGVIEPSERFVVMISATSTLLSGVSIADAEATGIIVNDDTAPITVRTPTPVPTAVPQLVARPTPIPTPAPRRSTSDSSDAPSAGATPTPTPIRIVATRAPVVLVAPTPTPTPIPTPSPTPLPTPTQTPAATPTSTPTPLPTPTAPSAVRSDTPTPTPSPSPLPTPTRTPRPTPTPATALLVDPPTPPALTESGLAQRTRGALDLVTSAGRERLTLVVVLVPILVVAGIAFAYLILRRR